MSDYAKLPKLPGLHFRAQHVAFYPGVVDHNRPRQICRALVMFHKIKEAMAPDDPMVMLRQDRPTGALLN